MPLKHSSKSREPAELSHEFKKYLDSLKSLPDEGKETEKMSAELDKILDVACSIIFGEHEDKPDPIQAEQLIIELFRCDCVGSMIDTLPKLSFEGRKSAAQIVCRAFRDRGNSTEFFDSSSEHVFSTLVAQYDNPEIALFSGQILRESFRHRRVVAQFLGSPSYQKLLTYLNISNFDISSDAFSTFHDVLTRHKRTVASYIDKNFDTFFDEYHKLLRDKNYVTRRMSLKILGELLLDRENFNIMLRYVQSVDNLMLIMQLLRDKYAAIQFEAFHIFKVFVANPKKNDGIKQILSLNRDKLLAFLSKFQEDKEDEQFTQEKELLLKEIGKLEQIDPDRS